MDVDKCPFDVVGGGRVVRRKAEESFVCLVDAGVSRPVPSDPLHGAERLHSLSGIMCG